MNDLLQYALVFIGYAISMLGIVLGFLLTLFSYLNLFIFLLLLFVLVFKRKKKEFFFELSLEIIYCLAVPYLYLSLLFNTNINFFFSEKARLENSASFNLLAFVALTIYWLIRIIPISIFKTENIFRIVSRVSIYLCLFTLTLFIWKDCSFMIAKITEAPSQSNSRFFNFSLLLFYFIPYFLGIRRLFLIQISRPNDYERDDLIESLKRYRLVGILFLGLIAFNLFQKTDPGIRLRLKSFDSDINKYSKEYGVDKKLLQAILYTNYKHYLNPIKFLAEYTALGFWVFDEKNNLGWAEKFSVSVGPAQIQPTTAQRAILLGMLNFKNQPEYWSKNYRAGSVQLTPEWKIKNATLNIKTIHLDPISPFQIAMELVDISTNLEYCAYIIYLYQSQWKSANYDISTKPDILATLYQIGFHKSIPKPNPASNDYGKQVLEAYEYFAQER
jgi:hypothetical protein